MRTALRIIRGACLIGSLLCAGCLWEAESPDSVSSVNHNTMREKPAWALIDEERIRQVTVAEIAEISPQPRSAEYHRVQRGETLSAIAARYHTTPEQLAGANGLGDPNQLAVDGWLYLPKGNH